MDPTALTSPARAGDALTLPRASNAPCQGSGILRHMARSAGCIQYSVLDLGRTTRFVIMAAPRSRGIFAHNAREELESVRALLRRQTCRPAVTVQTVFLRNASDETECERIVLQHCGAERPLTTYVAQAPCSGAALAIEAWAIGGDSVQVERYGRDALVVDYDGLRWVHCTGGRASMAQSGLYSQAWMNFAHLTTVLGRAGSQFEHVVRTWIYLGGITTPETECAAMPLSGAPALRYHELNRARKDFFAGLRFGRNGKEANGNGANGAYPASTGIGMSGSDLEMTCLALETSRKDVRLVPLENPLQVPAYAYPHDHAAQSPKFSRAIALAAGDRLTIWISGTASIVASESAHCGDIESQTEQTIENIQRLIAPENFAAHGLSRTGARLKDLDRIRVYLKRLEDFEKCQAICRRRFGAVPALYVVADICRPELLVEIEGVAFV